MHKPFQIVSAQLPTSLAERLRELAAENDRSFSAELRIAAREHLERADDQRVAA
jgi:predicted DNA-binding protein